MSATTTVRFVSRATTVRFPICSVSTAQVAAAIATWQTFLSNEAAFNALGNNKPYVAGIGNVEVAPGTMMRTYLDPAI